MRLSEIYANGVIKVTVAGFSIAGDRSAAVMPIVELA